MPILGTGNSKVPKGSGKAGGPWIWSEWVPFFKGLLSFLAIPDWDHFGRSDSGAHRLEGLAPDGRLGPLWSLFKRFNRFLIDFYLLKVSIFGAGWGFFIFLFFPFSYFFIFILLLRGSAAAAKKKTPELKLFILFKKARKVRRSRPRVDPAPSAGSTIKRLKTHRLKAFQAHMSRNVQPFQRKCTKKKCKKSGKFSTFRLFFRVSNEFYEKFIKIHQTCG